ncbi:MAG: penicillin-binding protein activator [Moraxellaceae bacterium]
MKFLPMLLAVWLGMYNTTHAEVLVILPEQGGMLAAAQSVRDGLLAAYYDRTARPALRFVHDDPALPIDQLLAKTISPQTQLVIGPLPRERVEALIASAPQVPVLALNQVASEHRNVWEFALAPEEDVSRLIALMRADGVREVLLLTENGQQGNSRFEAVFSTQWQGKLTPVSQVPSSLKRGQGVLLLGSGAWLEMLNDLPTERLYSTAFAFNQVQPVKLGLQYCDIPALYRHEWPELIRQAEQKPVSVAYQRLVAFGADAWQLALLRLQQAPSANLSGRTGELSLRNHQIERAPDCRKATPTGWVRVR